MAARIAAAQPHPHAARGQDGDERIDPGPDGDAIQFLPQDSFDLGLGPATLAGQRLDQGSVDVRPELDGTIRGTHTQDLQPGRSRILGAVQQIRYTGRSAPTR
jgi:hypothetical protein